MHNINFNPRLEKNKGVIKSIMQNINFYTKNMFLQFIYKK
ncbi:hypothetical protein BN165_1090015 [Clostridioides difficile E1]|nr:hypothetical protein BN164_1060013 [Clostridioides difficile T20]CCK94426.1 hypothetical protein BN165_1090015 [Clostridioides difficile E1]CCL02359.1 hypothetical protein BN167_1300014 [Clostridioides difficile E13]